MRNKEFLLIVALSALFLVTYYAHPTKQEGFEFVVDKKEFLLKNFKHTAILAGEWKDKDYVLTVEINSPDHQLDLKLVLKDDERRGHNGSLEKEKNYQYKDGKISNLASCAANKTRQSTNGICKLRPPGMISKAYNFCKICAVAALNCWINGPKMLLNAMDSIYNGAIWLVSKGYGGLTFAIDWTHTEVTLLTYKVHDGMIVAKEWSWVQVKWLVWNAFYALMLTTYWTFYIVWWIGSGIWVQIEWIGDAFNFYYYFYLESHVTYIKDLADSVPRTYVLIFVSTITNAIFSLKFIIWAVGKYRLRRQARLEQREAAERAAAAAASSARRRRKGPNQNKKNKTKKDIL